MNDSNDVNVHVNVVSGMRSNVSLSFGTIRRQLSDSVYVCMYECVNVGVCECASLCKNVNVHVNVST